MADVAGLEQEPAEAPMELGDEAAAQSAAEAAALQPPQVVNDEADEDEEEEQEQTDAGGGKKRLGKTARRKQKQRAKKAAGLPIKPVRAEPPRPSAAGGSAAAYGASSASDDDVVVEYTLAPASVLDVEADPSLAVFADIFKKFAPDSVDAGAGATGGGEDDGDEGEQREGGGDEDSAGSDGEGGAGAGAGASKSRRERKRHLQDHVAALKRAVSHPEVVESHDVTAADPKLLVHLKAYRNTVPVPRHWCHKRRYLQGKRGFVKPPFQLPDFILQTGIAKMREADADATDAKTLKSRTRERARPKMGRIEIDYQVLHDAFFRHQTRPNLTPYGNVYYEGKELEKSHDGVKPGLLSEKLRTALGMGSDSAPPPWLLAMQRYGPPPSYPSLRIPGLNAPLPPGAVYGHQWGQWGYPPVDELGQPLYGNPFGVSDPAVEAAEAAMRGAGAVKHHWGEAREAGGYGAAYAGLEEEEKEEEGAGAGAGAEEEGTASVLPEGAASVAPSLKAGMETPDVVDLRKGPTGRKGEETPSGPAPSRPAVLYQVLEQKEQALSGGLLGTKHTYVLPGAGGAGAGAGAGLAMAPAGGSAAGAAGAVSLALTPEELAAGKLSEADLAARYEAEAARAAASARGDREDVSDLLEEQERKARKRKGGDGEEGGKRARKAAKDFKF